MPFRDPHKPNIDVQIIGSTLYIRTSSHAHLRILITDAVELAYYVQQNEIELLSRINEHAKEQHMDTDGGNDEHSRQ